MTSSRRGDALFFSVRGGSLVAILSSCTETRDREATGEPQQSPACAAAADSKLAPFVRGRARLTLKALGEP